MRQLLPSTHHLGQKAAAGRRGLVERFVAAKSVVTDGRGVDERALRVGPAVDRLDQRVRGLGAALHDAALARLDPSPSADVLAGQVDHHVRGRRFARLLPRERAPGAHFGRIARNHRDVVAARNEPAHERLANEPGSAADHDSHGAHCDPKRICPA